ncbi:leucine-rich repeat domain-containing protein, partial [Ruminococcus bicirculans (ex Wegman et al. 2014)]|uniref:leucine-rich repeat domain-containing protein n=1 Tax=Ruminococcus bicirculans (ex Wegman et al. 2014) TaxID=1160721 RepID=UPI00325B9D68
MNSIFIYKKINGEVIITGLQEGVAETAIEIPETIENMPVVEIGPKAFEFSTITDIKIGINIRKIEKEAFAHCRKLNSVTWNCKCNAIPDKCFYRCTELKKFDFTAIKRVGQYAFGESGLQEVYIPQNIEMIGDGAFNICSELHSVTWN